MELAYELSRVRAAGWRRIPVSPFEPLGPAVLASWSQGPIHSFLISLSQFELSFSSSRKSPDAKLTVIRTKTWRWEAAGRAR